MAAIFKINQQDSIIKSFTSVYICKYKALVKNHADKKKKDKHWICLVIEKMSICMELIKSMKYVTFFLT